MKIELTFFPESKLFGFCLRVAWYSFLDCLDASIYVVWGNTSHIWICISVINFYIFLNIASLIILSIIAVKNGATWLEYSFLRSNAWMNVILRTSRHLFSKFNLPERAMLWYLFYLRNFRFVIWIVHAKRRWFSRCNSKVRPHFVLLESIGFRAKWSTLRILPL